MFTKGFEDYHLHKLNLTFILLCGCICNYIDCFGIENFMSKIKSIKLLLFIIFDIVDSVNRRIVIHEQVFLSFKIPDNYWP